MSDDSLIALLILVAILTLIQPKNRLKKRSSRQILLADDEQTMESCCGHADSFGIKVIKQLPFISGMVCEIEEGQDQKLLTLNQSLRIEADAKVYIVEENILATAIPTDTISLTGAPSLWSKTKGQGISVAIIDTGVAEHPDLNIKGGLSTLGDVFTDDFFDDNGHGTHVAGIVGANGGTRGLLGMAPEVDLYAVKALDKNGSGYVSDIIEGIAFAVQEGIDVANLSLGTGESSEALHRAVRKAALSSIILVAAAGNTGMTENPELLYPAKYPEVLSVGSVNNNEVFSRFSSYGPELDILAYGENILSTFLGKSYRRESGTSMASPQVSGALALLLGLGYKKKDAIRVLLKNAKHLSLPVEKQGRGLLSLAALANQY